MSRSPRNREKRCFLRRHTIPWNLAKFRCRYLMTSHATWYLISAQSADRMKVQLLMLILEFSFFVILKFSLYGWKLVKHPLHFSSISWNTRCQRYVVGQGLLTTRNSKGCFFKYFFFAEKNMKFIIKKEIQSGNQPKTEKKNASSSLSYSSNSNTTWLVSFPRETPSQNSYQLLWFQKDTNMFNWKNLLFWHHKISRKIKKMKAKFKKGKKKQFTRIQNNHDYLHETSALWRANRQPFWVEVLQIFPASFFFFVKIFLPF